MTEKKAYDIFSWPGQQRKSDELRWRESEDPKVQSELKKLREEVEAPLVLKKQGQGQLKRTAKTFRIVPETTSENVTTGGRKRRKARTSKKARKSRNRNRRR